MKDGWQTSILGDVLAVLKNGLNCKQDKSGRGAKISRIESISDATFDLDRVGYAEISERDKGKYRLQPGDILFSHINSAVHVGKTAVFDSSEPVYHGVNLLLMRPKEVVTSAYLDHALKYLFQSGYWQSVCKQSVNQASVNQQDISRVQIRYPRLLREQQRIVGILDEAFKGIASAKANAEKNLQNARALFESHLQSVFTQRDGGWPTKQLGNVCDFEGGSQPPKSQFSYDPKNGYVRFLQIRDFGSEKHVTFIPESKKNRLCVEEDIMIGRYGASVGKILTGKAGAYNVALMRTIPDRAQLDRRFFYHYLISGAFQERLKNVAERSAQNGFSKEDIFGFPVPVPPLKEQKKVIEQLLPLSKETQRLATLYTRKLAALEALKNSLLHEAFTGQL